MEEAFASDEGGVVFQEWFALEWLELFLFPFWGQSRFQ
jgi:hypothetical protein